MKDYFDIDLQLFADEEEIDEAGLDELDEEEETESDDEELEDGSDEEPEDTEDEEDGETEEELEHGEDSEPVKKPKDKVTAALIKKKQELKRIKDENEKIRAELEAIKKAQKENEQKKAFQAKKQQYIDEFGYDEISAEKLAKIDMLEKKVEMSKYERQAERLEDKYPKIWDKLEQFAELSKATGWSLEKICEVEFGKPVSEFDIRTKVEQEALLRKQKKAKSKPVTSTSTPLQSVKLSPEDEKAYQVYKKFNPGISRKQYKETILNPKWEEE